MKIALVRKDVIPEGGGAERYAATLAAELERRGHEVHLYAARVAPGLPSTIRVHRVPILMGWSPVKNWGFVLGARRAIAAEEARGGPYDIIHALSQVWPSDVYRIGDGLHRRWIDLTGSRIGRALKALSLRHRVILAIERRIFRPGATRRFIANSAMVRAQAIATYRVPPGRIDVVYNGVDAGRFAARGDRDGVRRRFGMGTADLALLFVGHNFGRKGLAVVLEAMARDGGTDLRLLVVGKEPRGGAWRRRVRRLGLEGRIHFVGPTRAIEDYHAAADALVLPTLYDPCANVCLEAMAAARVVVTTRSNGAAELIRHGESGFVLPPGTHRAECVDALSALLPQLRQEGLRKVVGARAAQVSAVLTPALNAEATLKIYRRVVTDREGDAARARPLPIERLGDLEVHAVFAPLLREAAVGSLEDLLALPVVETLKAARPERATERVQIAGRPFARKRFEGDARGAAAEWHALGAFAEEGVPAPTPVAQGAAGGRSVLVTALVEGYERLDHWAAAEAERLPRRELAARRRAVIEALGREVGRMHRAGFTHRDLYLCHVFVRWRGGPEFIFMDLHRAEDWRTTWRRRPPRRRIVKDLAALAFSASPVARLSTVDRLRFLRAWRGEGRLRAADRVLGRAVLAKAARMAHHNRGRDL